MKAKHLSLLIAIILVPGCKSIAQKEVDNFDASYRYGAKYANTFKLNDLDVPLPTGTFELIYHEGYISNINYLGSGAFGVEKQQADAEAVLVSMDGDQVTSAVFIRTTILAAEPKLTYPAPEFCKQSNLLSLTAKNTKNTNQDCWATSYADVSQAEENDYISNGLKVFSQEEELVTPGDMLYTEHWLTDKNKKLRVRYFFNPLTEAGISYTDSFSWKRSDWNVNRIQKHPTKQEYADKVENRGKLYHNALRDNFNNQS